MNPQQALSGNTFHYIDFSKAERELGEVMKFRIGGWVRVKDGIEDPDFGNDMSGWQGQISEIADDTDSHLDGSPRIIFFNRFLFAVAPRMTY